MVTWGARLYIRRLQFRFAPLRTIVNATVLVLDSVSRHNARRYATFIMYAFVCVIIYIQFNICIIDAVSTISKFPVL